MKFKSPLWFVLPAMIYVLMFASQCFLFAEEGDFIEVGANCSEPDQQYHSTSEISKTPWELNELYAVPAGTLSPDQWDESSSFNVQFHTQLDSTDSVGFAQATTEVWQDFFSEDATVIFNVRRTITATDEILQCISGIWAFNSIQPLAVQDISDWLTTGNSPYDVTDLSSQSLLQSDLQSAVDSLNSQPGADSEP